MNIKVSSNIYEIMQATVDAVHSSAHPSSKVAASIYDGVQLYTCTNHWPDSISGTIGTEQKIGNSSGTIHAETAAIFQTPRTKGASLFVTDPPCPNCAKNMAEAGISHIYIDHKGFAKDFAARRGEHFETLSMRIFEAAGISVYELWRKEERLNVIHEPDKNYTPINQNPVVITKQNNHELIIPTDMTEPFALCVANDKDDQPFSLMAKAHPTLGITNETMTEWDNDDGKYSLILQPLNRLMVRARYHGLDIIPDKIYSSRVPTSRELVNFIGTGLDHLHIGDTKKARDPFGIESLSLLKNHKILK